MLNLLLLSVFLILMLLHAHTFPYPKHAFMVIHQNLQNKCSCHNSSFRMHFFRTDNRTLGKLDFFCKHGRIEACLSKLKLNNLNIPLFSQITFKQQLCERKSYHVISFSFFQQFIHQTHIAYGNQLSQKGKHTPVAYVTKIKSFLIST